jgi:beta-glucuronidase
MLRRRDTPTRERRSLNGLWRFRLGADGAGRRDGWFDGPLRDSRAVPVPASDNDLFADERVRDHVGDAWYQTTVRVPAGWAGRPIVLRPDSATQHVISWLAAGRSPSTRTATRPSRPTSPRSSSGAPSTGSRSS